MQVGLFNVMEERDVQVKGYRVRLPLDVLVVASANPEDYTSRGRIITPLKDRYAAQIRTHYPPTRDLELAIVKQEACVPAVPDVAVHVPDYMQDVVVDVTFEARSSPDVSQASGVSVRMSIANYETLVANAVRRALRNGETEAVPRISDLLALAASTTGKLELEYAGAERSEERDRRRADQARDARRSSTSASTLEGVASVVECLRRRAGRSRSRRDLPADDYLEGLDEIEGLREAATGLAGRRLAGAHGIARSSSSSRGCTSRTSSTRPSEAGRALRRA